MINKKNLIEILQSFNNEEDITLTFNPDVVRYIRKKDKGEIIESKTPTNGRSKQKIFSFGNKNENTRSYNFSKKEQKINEEKQKTQDLIKKNPVFGQELFESSLAWQRYNEEYESLEDEIKDLFGSFHFWRYSGKFLKKIHSKDSDKRESVFGDVLSLMVGRMRGDGIPISSKDLESMLKSELLEIDKPGYFEEVDETIKIIKSKLLAKQAIKKSLLTSHLFQKKSLIRKTDEAKRNGDFYMTKSLHDIAESIMELYEKNGDSQVAGALLYGPAGTSKTEILVYISKIMGWETIVRSIKPYDDGSKLLEELTIPSNMESFPNLIEKFVVQIKNFETEIDIKQFFVDHCKHHNEKTNLDQMDFGMIKKICRELFQENNLKHLISEVNEITNINQVKDVLVKYYENVMQRYYINQTSNIAQRLKNPFKFMALGPLGEALVSDKSVTVVLDEINAALYFKGLNAFLASINKDVFVHGTANTGKEYGNRPIAIEIINRFKLMIKMGYLPPEEEKIIFYTLLSSMGEIPLNPWEQNIVAQIPDLIVKLREEYNKRLEGVDDAQKWRQPISIRNLISFCEHIINKQTGEREKDSSYDPKCIYKAIMTHFGTSDNDIETDSRQKFIKKIADTWKIDFNNPPSNLEQLAMEKKDTMYSKIAGNGQFALDPLVQPTLHHVKELEVPYKIYNTSFSDTGEYLFVQTQGKLIIDKLSEIDDRFGSREISLESGVNYEEWHNDPITNCLYAWYFDPEAKENKIAVITDWQPEELSCEQQPTITKYDEDQVPFKMVEQSSKSEKNGVKLEKNGDKIHVSYDGNKVNEDLEIDSEIFIKASISENGRMVIVRNRANSGEEIKAYILGEKKIMCPHHL